jgi:hypothetical protein
LEYGRYLGLNAEYISSHRQCLPGTFLLAKFKLEKQLFALQFVTLAIFSQLYSSQFCLVFSTLTQPGPRRQFLGDIETE